jgi:hypothetical protein
MKRSRSSQSKGEKTCTRTFYASGSFYADTFQRPSDVPLNQFFTTVQSMKETKARNESSPRCEHEFAKGNGGKCARSACNASLSKERVKFEQTWRQRIIDEDSAHSLDEHFEMLHRCAVTIEFLLAFTFDHDCWDRTTWDVNLNIIKPATKANRCRYVQLDGMSEFTGPADIFISHCWGKIF